MDLFWCCLGFEFDRVILLFNGFEEGLIMLSVWGKARFRDIKFDW